MAGWVYDNNYNRYVKDVQVNHPKAYTMWTREDEQYLTKMVERGFSMSYMARVLQRQESGVFARMAKLDLERETMTPCYHVLEIDEMGRLTQLSSGENKPDVLMVASHCGGGKSKRARQLFLVARGVNPQELGAPTGLVETGRFSPKIKGL